MTDRVYLVFWEDGDFYYEKVLWNLIFSSFPYFEPQALPASTLRYGASKRKWTYARFGVSCLCWFTFREWIFMICSLPCCQIDLVCCLLDCIQHSFRLYNISTYFLYGHSQNVGRCPLLSHVGGGSSIHFPRDWVYNVQTITVCLDDVLICFIPLRHRIYVFHICSIYFHICYMFHICLTYFPQVFQILSGTGDSVSKYPFIFHILFICSRIFHRCPTYIFHQTGHYWLVLWNIF